MHLEKGRISPLQLKFMVIGYVLGSSLLLVPGAAARRDSWLAILLGIVEGLAIAAVFLGLFARFPDMTLTQIMKTVYGPILGSLLVIPYLWFFLHLCSLVLGNYVDFLTVAVMPETPSMVFGVLVLVACGSAARNGIEVIARCSQVLVPIMLVFFIINVILSLPGMDLKNLLPMLNIPLTKFLWASHGTATFPLAETVSFLPLLPFVSGKGATRSTLSAITLSGLVLVLLSLRNTAVLGATEFMYTYPSFEAVRMINIGKIITRMEVLVVISFLIIGFVKISVLLYGTTLTLTELFRMRSYLHLVYPVAVVVIALQTINFSNVSQNFVFANESWPIYSLPVELLLPLMTLVIAMIRRLPQKVEKK